MNISRRDLIKMLAATAALPSVSIANDENSVHEKTIRVAFIGVGNRGTGLLRLLLNLAGVEVVAVCDTIAAHVWRARQFCDDAGARKPEVYFDGEYDYKNMLAEQDLDAVFIATPWKWHAEMAIVTMESGSHALVEVPAAQNIEECWSLVETAEKTGMQCMMLENVCYGSQELMVLNMVQQGVFGELTHAEGAYIHEMRGKLLTVRPEQGNGYWRPHEWATRNGNLYPTHGIGPIAQYMNINRGDKFEYLVSMSSNSLARESFAETKLPERNRWKNVDFTVGDMNSSIIKTNKGRTIVLQYDVSTPRPYSRINFVQGTKGAFRGYPAGIVVDGITRGKKWESITSYEEKYMHPLTKKIGQLAQIYGGHGGMDFVMLWRVVNCLRLGVPLDQNVYDAASWSCIIELTAKSIAKRSSSVDFPDFTNGKWRTNQSFNLEELNVDVVAESP